jgi:hypothetical protein
VRRRQLSLLFVRFRLNYARSKYATMRVQQETTDQLKALSLPSWLRKR